MKKSLKKNRTESITHVILCLCIIAFYPAQAMSETTVQVTGDSDHYYYYGAESNAEGDAIIKLRKACKAKGMQLYEGKVVKNISGYRLTSNKYDDLKCKKSRNNDSKRCTIKVTGTCMSTDSRGFNMKCKSGKRAYANVEGLRKGALRIVTMDGDVITLSPSTIKVLSKPKKMVLMPKHSELPPPKTAKERAWDDLADSMCKGEGGSDFIAKAKKTLRRYQRQQYEKLVAKCENLSNAGKQLPPECVLDTAGLRQ